MKTASLKLIRVTEYFGTNGFVCYSFPELKQRLAGMREKRESVKLSYTISFQGKTMTPIKGIVLPPYKEEDIDKIEKSVERELKGQNMEQSELENAPMRRGFKR